MKLNQYTVAFTIDVEADTPDEAARRAWALLSEPEAMKPIATVIEQPLGEEQEIDLEELESATTDATA